MMPTESFLAVFLFSFSMAVGAVLTPGPVTTAIISQSPRLGWVTGLLVSIGHAMTELVLVVLITLGLSSVLGAPNVQVAIRPSFSMLVPIADTLCPSLQLQIWKK